MKALVLICLLFVGCYHEKDIESKPETYSFDGGTLTTVDSGIVFTFYDSVYFNIHQTLFLKLDKDIQRHPGDENVTITFKATFLEAMPNTN